MNAVKNNPYRTLGLFGNSSEKELQKQIATIKRFAEVGKTKAFDYDFPFFGEVVRSTEKVQEAASKIEQAKNKVHYALFWFLNSGHIDEAALNNLKDGHIEKATEIWEKTLKDSTVTVKNFAAISNLSTLQLGIVTYNGSFDPEKFIASIELKGKLIMSDACDSFITTVIGEGISINRDTILKEFADEVMQIIKPYLNKPNGIKSSQLISAFNSFPNEIKQYVSGKFTDRPINNIENQIEKTKNKRKENPRDAEIYGNELYNETINDLAFLKNIWNVNNVQYQMIVNKIANEVIQCSIDFFNIIIEEDSEFDPFEDAFKIAKLAKSLGPTGQIKDRIDESLSSLEEMRFRDCHKAINVLKAVKDAFIKLDKENQIRSIFDRMAIDQIKVNELIKTEITTEIVKKIAISNNQTIIEEFYSLLKFLFSRISSKNILNGIEQTFVYSLPDNSLIKIKIIEEKKQREKLEQERIERERIAAQKREQERIERERIESARKTKNALIWIGSIVAAIAIIYGIWGEDGLVVIGIIAVFLVIGFLRSL